MGYDDRQHPSRISFLNTTGTNVKLLGMIKESIIATRSSNVHDLKVQALI